jgi:mono/diheme cytochrome c family protein
MRQPGAEIGSILFTLWKEIGMRRLLLTGLLAVLGIMSTLALSGCSISLAEDIAPPSNYQPPATAVPATSAPLIFPIVKPDTGTGKAVFEEKCSPCHGQTGLGDGPQSAKLSVKVPMIGTAELARPARPVDWYNKVTQGNMEKYMPPFAQALSDRQRWDVVSYVFSLSAPENDVAAGKEIYTAQCVDCHGPSGRGDGPKAANLDSQPPDWGDLSRLVQKSGEELYSTVSKGAGKNMAAYANKLTEQQRWQVVAYVRSLAYTSAQAGQKADASQPTNVQNTPAVSGTETAQDQPAGKVTVSGKVVNGSGGTIPAGLKVELQGYEQSAMNPAAQVKPVSDFSAEANADGLFTFKDVPISAQRVFLATVQYNNMVYHSEMLRGADLKDGDQANINVTMYDTTNDASQLTVERMHIFFEFTTPDTVQVVTMYIISNPTNKVVTPATDGDPVVSFDLPQGATNLQFQDGALGDRYIQTASGFGDRQSIMPAPVKHQIVLAYDLPYNGKLALALKQPIAVQALMMAVPGGGVNLQGTGIEDAGERTVQGINFRFYNQHGLAADETLNVTLSGKPGAANNQLPSGASTNSLIIGGAAFTLAVAALAFFFVRQRKSNAPVVVEAQPAPPQETPELLLDAIIALDDQFKEGKMAQKAYQERRAELKEKLKIIQQKPT